MHAGVYIVTPHGLCLTVAASAGLRSDLLDAFGGEPRGETRTWRRTKARGSEPRAALVVLAVREGAASTLEPLT